MAAIFVKACGAENPAKVQEQILSGVDINSRAEFGTTGLLKAICWDRIATVHLLLSRSEIDVNKVDAEGRCPLHYAAWYNRSNILTALLADPRLNTVNLRCNEGSTPLLLAVDNNSSTCVKLLLEDPRTQPNAKFQFSRCCECYKCRTERKTRPNEPGATLTHGGSPLMWAVKLGYKKCVTILLADPRVNIMTTDSYRRSHSEVARLLSHFLHFLI